MEVRKLLIIGHAQHGKDTAAEILHKSFGYSFKASSVAASEIFLYAALKDKYGYQTPEECFQDRVNHRVEWHDLICEFNKDDKSALAKRIMESSDIYVGMRSDAEIRECMAQGIFDLIIGVFDPRKPLEDPKSFDIDLWSAADIIIPNAQSIEHLEQRITRLEPLLLSEQSVSV